jgi:hypothetical protein
MAMKILDEFAQFLARFDDEDLQQEYQIEFSTPDSPDDIARLTQRIGMPVPESHGNLLLTSGVFHHAHFGDTWQTLRLYSAKEMLDRQCGVVDAIKEIWGGRPELDAALTAEQIAKLNAEYVVFGYRYVDDNVHDYLFFDRRGGFYHLLFDQDDTADAEDTLRALAGQASASVSLEALLKTQFDGISKVIEEDYA